MQYLYCGGTDALHIRNTEVMDVSTNNSVSVLMLYNLAYLYLKGFYSVKQSNWFLLQQQYKTSVLSYYYLFHKLIKFISLTV